MTPRSISNSTDGIFVLLAMPLNRKDKIRITEASMIILYDENISINRINFKGAMHFKLKIQLNHEI